LEISETRICDKKGIALPTNPQEIDEMIKQLNESPQNLLSVIAECANNGEPAWHYNFDVFETFKTCSIEKIGVGPIKKGELMAKKIRIGECDVVLTSEYEGGFSVRCEVMPGCYSQGESEEEAITNIKEAMQNYIEAAKALGIPIRR
jgi:predicted RNase H-like HicB family nuclease